MLDKGSDTEKTEKPVQICVMGSVFATGEKMLHHLRTSKLLNEMSQNVSHSKQNAALGMKRRSVSLSSPSRHGWLCGHQLPAFEWYILACECRSGSAGVPCHKVRSRVSRREVLPTLRNPFRFPIPES